MLWIDIHVFTQMRLPCEGIYKSEHAEPFATQGRKTKRIDMLAFRIVALLVAVVSSLAGGASTGGTIGKLLAKLNNTMQAGVSDTHKSVDKLLTLGNDTVTSVAGLVSSGSNQISNLGINAMDMGGTLSIQGIDIMQDTVNGMMNVVPVPHGIISKVVNSSLDVGRGSVDATIGAGEAVAAVANAVTGVVTNSMASASSVITGKISAASHKGFGLISKAISKGVEIASEVVQKGGGILEVAGNKLATSATLPGFASATSSTS